MLTRLDLSEPITRETALPGREQEIPTASHHAVFSSLLKKPREPNHETIVFGMGCFWGAEKIFWQIEGVTNTAVGYAGGFTPNPIYEEICTGRTGHIEVVQIDYNPAKVSTVQLLKHFWEGHDPTQRFGQGNDYGPQYRSAVLWTSVGQEVETLSTREAYTEALDLAEHYSEIQTKISRLDKFYFAEDYHQQYLEKNPNGYCGTGGTGISCPVVELKTTENNI